MGQNAEIPAEGLGKGRDAVVQELQVFIAVPAEIEDLDGVGPDRMTQTVAKGFYRTNYMSGVTAKEKAAAKMLERMYKALDGMNAP